MFESELQWEALITSRDLIPQLSLSHLALLDPSNFSWLSYEHDITQRITFADHTKTLETPIWTPLETAKLPVHGVKTRPLTQRTKWTKNILYKLFQKKNPHGTTIKSMENKCYCGHTSKKIGQLFALKLKTWSVMTFLIWRFCRSTREILRKNGLFVKIIFNARCQHFTPSMEQL